PGGSRPFAARPRARRSCRTSPPEPSRRDLADSSAHCACAAEKHVGPTGAAGTSRATGERRSHMSQTLPERRTNSTPERWAPLAELDQVTERMRQMLEQTFGSF